MTTALRALVKTGHPGPCLAITAITVVLAVSAGVTAIGTLIIFAISVLAGQYSIGWSNDYADAALDAAAGRTDKPLVSGALRRTTVLGAAFVALALAFGLAFAIGPATAAWSVPVIGAGWAYNFGLKASLLSGLVFVFGFGPLPGLAASLLPGHPVPLAWSLAAASLLGLGAHFTNVLPDLSKDRASGVGGLPQRVAGAGGERAVRGVALGLLLGASVLIALAPGTGRRSAAAMGLAWAGLAAAVVLGAVALRSRGRTPFRCALAIAGVDVVVFALSGGSLT